VLTVVGLASSCHQIANTSDRIKKNIIAVETATSTATGAFIGTVAAILLISTPIGWSVALAIGIGAMATSYFTGKIGGLIYDKYSNHYDVVDVLSIDKACN